MGRRLRSAVPAAFGLLLAWTATAQAHGGGPTGTQTGNLSFLDPAPAGISYEWTLLMARGQKAEVVYFVGAKSWNEPLQPEGLKGWTHWSNWIALELVRPAKVKITVQRQQGVVINSGGTASVARYALVPAVSVYRGWDETTEFEAHVYNSAGNFWSTIEYMGSNIDRKGRGKVTYKAKLPAGHYSIVIGGNPPSRGAASNYPAEDCDPVDPICYQYTGFHGYRASINVR